MATQSEIAARAGVSVAVVSAVVNRTSHTRMSAETRRRVEQAISELGYSPNLSARSLRLRRSGMLGVVLHKLDNPVLAPMVRGIYDAATDCGSAVLLGDSNMMMRSGSQFLMRLLSEGTVDGVFVRGESMLDNDVLTLLRKRPTPLIMVESRESDDYPWVGIDDHAAARKATQFLLNLGHRRIVFVGGSRWYSARRRYAGYADTMRAAGATAYDHLMTGYGEQAGSEALRQAMGLQVRPTALVVNTVVSCLGVVSAAHDLGLSVPADLSIVGIHDVPMAEYLRPALTTVRMPMYELGRRAVEAMQAMLDGETPTLGSLREPEPELVIRGSATSWHQA